MDHFFSREREPEVDLESGGNASEEHRTCEDLVAADRHKDKISEREWSKVFSFAKSEKFVCEETSHSNSLKFCEDVNQNVELSMYKNSDSEESINYVALVAKKHVKDKCKKISSRNPPKPPRPPKGPSLDAADRKLIREMAEIAVRKRARVERMRTLKKMKASKASPSRSILSAMIVTLLFCLVLIHQGISSKSRAGTLAVGVNEDLISVQFHNNLSSHGITRPGSTSRKLVEDEVSGSDLQGEVDGIAIQVKTDAE